ncbi:cytochrome c [Roseateles asaccharophilus]|uniref:Signal transduction histidine kinase n=2 Tax=Roseateles asaccharophilus TaxID=582607 RepID=A0ABU2AHP0_9BURK|nr:signal transduction histidine kinase [Roseateles asaccharophilus]
MKRIPVAGLALAVVTLFAAPAAQAQNATKDDAVAMVKKGIAFIKANGKDKGYAAITTKDPQFIKHDLYLVVYGLDGKGLAHGANEKMVGRDLIDLKDIDGKPFIKERVELGKSKPGGFWQDYKFTNPTTKKVEPKQMYCERLDETIVCGGIYK